MSIKYEDIRLLNSENLSDLQQQAQERAVKSAVEQSEKHLSDYKLIPETFNGRYVCADTMKETFLDFEQSKGARGYYNSVIHNSAATLTNEQFIRAVSDNSDPIKDRVLFLTGIPGAGKSSTINMFYDSENNDLIGDVRAIFEGQIANPDTVIEKINKCLEKDCKVNIVVVDTPSKIALENTFKRFNEYGRGASTHIMAHIKGNTADGLKKIHDIFGDKVELSIMDRSNFFDDPVEKQGWKHLDSLRKEGNYDTIKSKLDQQLKNAYSSGRINQDCYNQAASKALDRRMVLGSVQRGGENGQGSRVSEENTRDGSESEAEIKGIINQVDETKRNQSAEIEQSYDALHNEKLEIAILAKYQQVNRLESLLINKIDTEKSKNQQPITKPQKGLKSLFSRKTNRDTMQSQNNGRLTVLERRLNVVKEIKNGMREGGPHVEYLAHKKVHFEHPDIVEKARQEKLDKELEKQKEKKQLQELENTKKKTNTFSRSQKIK